MEITGSYKLVGDQQTIWNLMVDPNAIARAIPGVREIVPVEGQPDTWRAEARIGISAISGTYAGIIHMSEIHAPVSYRLTVKGEGQQSFINGSAVITLSYLDEEGKTEVAWEAEAAISGKIARVGQRVVKAAAGLLSKQFFRGMAKQLNPNVADEPLEDETLGANGNGLS